MKVVNFVLSMCLAIVMLGARGSVGLDLSSLAEYVNQYCDLRDNRPACANTSKVVQVVECGPPGPAGPIGPPGVLNYTVVDEIVKEKISEVLNGSVAYGSFPQVGCQTAKFDLVLILDASGSVSSIGFEKMKRWASTFISSFSIGAASTRVGILVYSDFPNLVIELDDYSDINSLSEAVNDLYYLTGGTGTGKAIQHMVTYAFSESKGGRKSGLGFDRVAIVMTDGQSDDDVSVPAQRAKQAGIQLFVVGVGDVDTAELNLIASDPDSTHVFLVDDFDSIGRIRDSLKNSICVEQQMEARIYPAISKILYTDKAFTMRNQTDCTTVDPEEAKIRNSTGGVFEIRPGQSGRRIEVYCDLTTDEGGWTVFQRRMDGSENFLRNWTDYVNGFGEKHKEFWLGLEKLHRLVRDDYELRVDLEDWEGNKAHAQYTLFTIGDASTKYKINVGEYSGTAGDSLKHHNGRGFSTEDNDSSPGGDCPKVHKGGWWYNYCDKSQLNGLYHVGGEYTGEYDDGIEWEHWKNTGFYSMKFAEMKFRPRL